MGNLSGLDRLVRLIIGVLIAAFAYFNMTQGLWSTIILIVGIAVILTAIFGWCGVYSMFGFSTRKHSAHRISKKDIQRAVEDHMNAKAEAASSSKATKKSAAKKAAPKKAATKKTTAKKAAPKEVAAKKAAPKEVATKKTTAKKAAPKKVATKKTTAKKAAPKKAATKKTTTKKSK